MPEKTENLNKRKKTTPKIDVETAINETIEELYDVEKQADIFKEKLIEDLNINVYNEKIPTIKDNFINSLHGDKSYEIYYKGIKIYDSDITTSDIKTYDTYYIIFNKKYNYIGTRIKIK
jgi:hypothetical protein